MKFSKSLMVGLLSLGMTSTMAVPYAFAIQELPTVTVTARRPNTCTGMCLKDLADQIRQLASEAWRSMEDSISPGGPEAEEVKEVRQPVALDGCKATQRQRTEHVAGGIFMAYASRRVLPPDGQVIRAEFFDGSSQRFVFRRETSPESVGSVSQITEIQGCGGK